GVSFFGIKDLSKPDALLAGINILPILMTFFNILATLTTKKFTKRERVQAFVIAALFLVMLYNAPSALLIYWTTNNFIMLLKNIDISGIISGEKISGFMNYRFESEGWKKFFINTFIFLSSLCILGSLLLKFYDTFANKYFWQLSEIIGLHQVYSAAFILTFIFVWMLYTRFLANGFTISELTAKTFYFALSTILVLCYIKYVLFSLELFSRRNALIYSVMLFAYGVFAFILTISGRNLFSFASRLTNGRKNSLFFSSLIFCVIFICVFYPSLLYLTDPDFFLDSFIDTVTGVSTYGMTLLFALILIWPLIPELLQNIFAFIAAFLVCTAFINSFVLTESYGNINALQINTTMMTFKRAIIRDIISLAITCIIMILCVWRKYIKHLITAFILISFAMCGVSVYCYFNIRHDNKSQIAESINFPDYHNRLWRFSRTGQNVICLFLDGFTGDHVIKILAQHPELVKDLDGFIYFPDTLATGSATFYSTPSIYGGSNYKPSILNERPDITIREKYSEAFSILPNIFTSKDYDVIMTAPMLSANDANYINKLIHTESVMTLGSHEWQADYVPYWLDWAGKNNIPLAMKDSNDISKFLLILSLFRSIPFSIRETLYNNGNWTWGVSNQVLKMTLAKSFLPDLASLQFMGDFIQVDDDKPAFKFIYNSLSHPLWFMQPDSLQPVTDPYPLTEGQFILVDGLFPEHLYTETHILRFLADFVKSLKSKGIYDNTRIILVSDHDFGDSWQLNQNLNRDNYNGCPNALLMFKDFDSHGDLITSDSFMSIEDTPALLITGIAKHEVFYTLDELKNLSSSDRIRIFCGRSIVPPNGNEKLFNLDGGVYQVKGSMFKPENWTRIQ
ncbi:MAG: YidC/Oxa1 family membrane protein insertase, partial [Synergistaceae bacterium]|nr:YidC/Oxa1 family membrane protein insertase [Synergistaceae bacterium]